MLIIASELRLQQSNHVSCLLVSHMWRRRREAWIQRLKVELYVVPAAAVPSIVFRPGETRYQAVPVVQDADEGQGGRSRGLCDLPCC